MTTHADPRSTAVGLCEVTDCGKWVAEKNVTWCPDHGPDTDFPTDCPS